MSSNSLDDLMGRALTFAAFAHRYQSRKYTNIPYITHPMAVADIVRTVPHTAHMICAAYLHDVVEDCSVKIMEIEREFGPEVGGYVFWLTDASIGHTGNRKARKEIDRNHIASAPAEAQTIKVADLIDNTSSIMEHDPEFARVYMREKRLLIDILTKADPDLLARAETLIRSYEQSLLDKALQK